jgi:hypothetical protein
MVEEPRLLALAMLDRLAPEIVAVDLEEIERRPALQQRHAGGRGAIRNPRDRFGCTRSARRRWCTS